MTKFNKQKLISNYPNCTCISPHVTGPAFYDTAHGPDFFLPPAPLPTFRS